jgi:DAK2 domain fusion protein YloV
MMTGIRRYWVTEIIQYDGQTLKEAFKSAELSLEKQIDELNSLNVYPVPDGDTGINMFLTMQSANSALENLSIASAAEISAKVARGALLGARGNSGVILSQILRGFAKGMETKTSFTPLDFGRALHKGSDVAYKALITPVEGTILTVMKEASEIALKKAAQGASLKGTLTAVSAQARKTVDNTPELLPALKDAGVVDAGGKGLFYIFRGMRDSISQKKMQLEEPAYSQNKAGAVAHSGQYGFDLQFLIEGENLQVEEMRAKVEAMGESVLVVGDDHLVRVHIHTHSPQSVMDYCSLKGSLKDIVSENMDTQVENFNKRKSANTAKT